MSQSARTGDLFLVFSFSLLLFLAGIGRISLWDRDEPRYAVAAREMLRSGDWVKPTFNGEPRFHKPVFIYWVMAASFQIFGENELGARFFSAVAGAISCCLTYWLGCRMAGRTIGLIAAAMFAVSPLVVVECKLATTDAVLLASVLGAFALLWEMSRRRSRLAACGFWTLMAISILTKGPIGPAIVGITLVTWTLLTRNTMALKHLYWGTGLAWMAVLVAPWAIAIYLDTNGEFYSEAFGKHVIGRSLSPMEGHRGFPGYYLITALIGMFPWTLCSGSALSGVRSWLRKPTAESFLLSWCVAPMLLLELVRTKLPHYYLPCYPAWAILLAIGMNRMSLKSRFMDEPRARLRVGIFVIANLAFVGLLAWIAVALPQTSWPVGSAILLASGLNGAGVCFLIARQDQNAVKFLIAASGCVGLVTGGWLLPALEEVRLSRTVAERLKVHAGQDPIVLKRYREPSLVFYLGEPTKMASRSRDFWNQLKQHRRLVTVLDEKDQRTLREGVFVEPLETISGFTEAHGRWKKLVVARVELENPPPQSPQKRRLARRVQQ